MAGGWGQGGEGWSLSTAHSMGGAHGRPGVHVCCVASCHRPGALIGGGPCRLGGGGRPDWELRRIRVSEAAGQPEWGGCSALIVKQCTLLWAKGDFLGTSSEEWAVLHVTVTALPFPTADAALPRPLLCPLCGPRSCPQPSWLPHCRRPASGGGGGMSPLSWPASKPALPAALVLGGKAWSCAPACGKKAFMIEHQPCALCCAGLLMSHFISPSQ